MTCLSKIGLSTNLLSACYFVIWSLVVAAGKAYQLVVRSVIVELLHWSVPGILPTKTRRRHGGFFESSYRMIEL